MSLATRCIACGTVFRVVQDQLRVSSGWVRCGRCSEVFNAIESLVDLDVDRPEEAPASVHGSRVMEELSRVSGLGGLEAPAGPAARADLDGPAAGVPAAALSTDEPVSAPPGPSAATEAEADVAMAAVVQVPLAGHGQIEPTTEAGAGSSVDRWTQMPDAPGFVRQADRAARWRRPWVRAGVAVVGLVAAAALVWQVHLTHHDWVAARWPTLQPAVIQLCVWSGCQLQAPRHIDGLVVDSSGLVRAPGADSYRLAVSLRNRSAMPVRPPALDLAVTDAAGQVLARRVLRAKDLGEAAERIAPGGELVVSGVLRIRGAQVTGYTIELFYP